MTLLSLLKSSLYPHQHPDAALRYLPIVDLIKKNNWENKKILEIGSGSYGITPYLKKEITGIDFDFSEPETPLLKQVKGVGEKLPFKTNAFDLVILSDVLEHVKPKNRTSVLVEAIRVAKIAVLVGGPFGQVAFAHDRHLSTVLNHYFLKEHLLYGLPEVEVVTKLSHPKIQSTHLVGTYLNLAVREQIMRLFAQKNKFAYYLYLKGLMPFVPLLAKLNRPPCYRTVFLIRLNQ